MVRILLIDSDFSAGDLKSALTKEGYGVDLAVTAPAGLIALEKGEYDLALVDWLLADMEGSEICRRLLLLQPLLPVVVLSCRDEVEDKICALDTGAQDFLVRPCQLLELSARLRSILRRYTSKKAELVFVPLNTQAKIPLRS
jgi:DNA-binding response OmpR family regulator